MSRWLQVAYKNGEVAVDVGVGDVVEVDLAPNGAVERRTLKVREFVDSRSCWMADDSRLLVELHGDAEAGLFYVRNVIDLRGRGQGRCSLP